MPADAPHSGGGYESDQLRSSRLLTRSPAPHGPRHVSRLLARTQNKLRTGLLTEHGTTLALPGGYG